MCSSQNKQTCQQGHMPWISWQLGGKTPKKCSPQPVEKIKLHLLTIQSKDIVIDFLLASINGLVLSRGATRILLLLGSVGYHSNTPFGKGGETEATESYLQRKTVQKRSFFLIFSISCPLEVFLDFF